MVNFGSKLFVGKSGYTPSARQWAAKNDVLLVDVSDQPRLSSIPKLE